MTDKPQRISPEAFDRIAESMPSLGRDPASMRKRIEMMEHLLERMFVIPGINRPVGLDSILGLVPVVGDVATAAMGAWIVWEARNVGMSKLQITRMAGNIGIDSLIGAVPIVGDLFDFVFRSNTRNLKLIKRHLDKHHPASVIVDATPALRAKS